MAEHYIIDDKEHVYESAAEKHLTDKTITENGTYSAEDEPGDINGYKEVTVDVEGGGGILVISKSDWDDLTTEEKQAYGLTVIQTASTGFQRGLYVNGADYRQLDIIASGGARPGTNLGYTFEEDGDYKLCILTFNCMANTAQLNNTVTLNNKVLTPTQEYTNPNSSGGDNQRNYRISCYELNNITIDDIISISASNVSSYTEVMYIIFKTDTPFNNLTVKKSLADMAMSYSGYHNGFSIYGSCVGNGNGDYNITADEIFGQESYTIPNLSTSYCSTFLFIFERT